VQASSSLSMGHTRTLSRGSLHQEFYFGHFFARVFQVIVRVIRGVARPYMTAVFLFDQILACTESATSEYSTTSQCLSALLGRPGRAKCILDGLRWGKQKKQRTNHSHTTTAWWLSTRGCNQHSNNWRRRFKPFEFYSYTYIYINNIHTYIYICTCIYFMYMSQTRLHTCICIYMYMHKTGQGRGDGHKPTL